MQRLDIWDDIVRLRDEENLSYGEIGQRLGKDKGQIRRIYLRAKQEREVGQPTQPTVGQATEPTMGQPTQPTPTFSLEEMQALKQFAASLLAKNEVGQPTQPTMHQPTDYSPSSPLIRRHLTLEKDVWIQVQNAAKDAGVSVSEMINRILREYLSTIAI